MSTKTNNYKKDEVYRAAEQTAVRAAKADGREAIDAATAIGEGENPDAGTVAKALKDAKAEIDKIKTAAELDLEDAKATAIAKVNTVDASEYVTDDQNKVTTAKTTAITAINAAFKDINLKPDLELSANIAFNIKSYFETNNITPSVEKIQDLVEENLMNSEYSDVARAYIRYRYKREVARTQKDAFMSAVGEKLEARNVQNQNANVDEHSFGGRIGEAASTLTKQYALDYLISPMAKANHLNNRIYIHDLDHYAVGDHNCLSIPFDDLLASGFNTRQTDVRPANSVGTAMQLVAVIFQLQSL